MSYLFTKQAGVPLSLLSLSLITNAQTFSEIGVAYNDENNEVVRLAGFGSLDEAVYSIPEEFSALLYLDNPSSEYPFDEFSPVRIADDLVFALCGEMLALTADTKYRSNNSVFAKNTLIPVWQSGPELLESQSFQWLISKVARSFVGGALLKGDGSFIYYNGHLFEDSDGIKFMDSEKLEKESSKSAIKKLELTDIFG